MFVEPGRHPDRIRKIEPKGAYREAGVIGVFVCEYRKFQGANGEPMCILRIEDAQQRAHKSIEEPDHRASPGNMPLLGAPATLDSCVISRAENTGFAVGQKSARVCKFFFMRLADQL
jgi:hypothetical protein